LAGSTRVLADELSRLLELAGGRGGELLRLGEPLEVLARLVERLFRVGESPAHFVEAERPAGFVHGLSPS